MPSWLDFLGHNCALEHYFLPVVFVNLLLPLFFIFRISDNCQATQSISSLEVVSVKRKHIESLKAGRVCFHI